MKKFTAFFALVFAACVPIFANAPDMAFFLPTEYRLMTELYKNDAQGFIRSRADFMEKCELINARILDGREFPEQKILYEKGRVFFENVNHEKFIWVLLPLTRNEIVADAVKNTDWAREFQYIIALFRSGEERTELLFAVPTCIFSVPSYEINTFQIVKGRRGNKGIIHYRNILRYDFTCDSDNHLNGVSYRKEKGQAQGYSIANYYLFDEKSKSAEFEEKLEDCDFGWFPTNWNKIKIDASAFLWDLKNPLKYGLQNAFDGNPATSFVENTDDDLMNIDIWLGKSTDKAAIINGYAKNTALYESNNRIKGVSNSFELSDNVLGYQFVPCRSSNIIFTSFYKGKKYGDTCLAEINFLLDGEWLFSDIDE